MRDLFQPLTDKTTRFKQRTAGRRYGFTVAGPGTVLSHMQFHVA